MVSKCCVSDLKERKSCRDPKGLVITLLAALRLRKQILEVRVEFNVTKIAHFYFLIFFNG